MQKNLIKIPDQVPLAMAGITEGQLRPSGWPIALLALMLIGALPAFPFELGPAFTYHGRLQNNAVSANGSYDLTFSLYTNNTGGTAVAGPLTNTATAVNDGIFTARLNFGPGVFDGTAYWLEIGVRTNGDGDFTILSPRHELLATPYAVYAENARASGLDGTIPEAALRGTYGSSVNFTNPGNVFVGNGSGLTNVSAVSLGGLGVNQFWQLSGNAGTTPGLNFVGTTDNQPLDLYADNVRALRLVVRSDSTGIYSNAPNVIGGSAINFIKTGVVGGSVGGGGAYDTNGNSFPNRVNANFGTVSGGIGNVANGPGSFIGGGGIDGTGFFSGNNASGNASVIGGGLGNTNSGYTATIGGGYGNAAGFLAATVAGGQANMVGSSFGTVGGGSGNSANGYSSTVGGGSGNAASKDYATVPGGFGNSAAGYSSFAAGQYAQATRYASFVWGDGSQNPFTGAAADNAFSILSSGGLFLYNGTNGLHVDSLGNNDGALDFGLRFGGALSSGEGIASKRTAGGNQYGLDFYTSSNARMSIDNNGKVGINTTSPSQRLEVNGNYALIDGGNAADGAGAIEAYIGGDGSGSDVQVGSMNSAITAVGFWNTAAGAWMHIGCSSITIHGGADLAEPFLMADEGKEIPQGAVVIIDDERAGQLKISNRAYDSRVAGVVSGANGINPGIQLQQQGLLEGGKNVALTGRVYVQAEALNDAIKPGDLLTTSPIPGHAMKAADHAKAQGAILGKAMTGLETGRGMVLVLVTLQ
jgi:hypothetical protein